MYLKTLSIGLLALLPLTAIAAPPTSRFVLRKQVAVQRQVGVPRNAPRIVTFEDVAKRTLTVKVQNYAADFTELIVERREGKSWRKVGAVKRVDHRKKRNPRTVDHRARPRSVYTVRDKGLEPGVTHTYRARAMQPRVGWLIGAESVVTTRPLELPLAPSAVRITAVTDTSMSLAWRDRASNETGFLVSYRRAASNDKFQTGAVINRRNALSHRLTGLKPATEYEVTVKARNEDGLSPAESFARGKTANAASTPDPVETTITRTIFLEAQPIQQGHQPYAAVWPPAGVINGRLEKISIPNVVSKTLFIRFIKKGHSTSECGNPSAVVTLTDGQSSTSSQIEALFGSEQPKFPLLFLACVGTSQGLVGDRVAINLTYTLNE